MRKLWTMILALLLVLGAAAAMAEGARTSRYAEVATQQGTLNMRAEPKDKAKIIKKLQRGTVVEIIEVLDTWTEVRQGKDTGYVKTDFLKEVAELPYSTITKESDGDAIIAFKRALYKLEYIKSDDINMQYDQVLESALTKLQLMNQVTLNPQEVTPELQALIDWGMISKGKSGYVDVVTDASSGLTVGIFCWDSDGTLYEKDQAVKLEISFAAQAVGGVGPYTITVTKSLSGGGPESGDEVTSPFSHIWGQDSDRVYLYATAEDAAGHTVTACAPFRYSLPDRYQGD